MDYSVTFPTFTRAPEDYSPRYFNDLVRMLNLLTTDIRNPGVGQQTTIILTALQNNDSGLRPGTIFQHGGALRIPVIDSPYVAPQVAYTRVGTVNINIT